eukprot:TRINITY_DN6903_c0_g1_i1.p2 TRINITY_DN6903_c0_g1~~TRINITY_DN6903_c0_g1_i1.p2  ORF type:complete len:113 (+),score=1.45 TRINITY_DN6903_c0_g1_i1:99-437(+)
MPIIIFIVESLNPSRRSGLSRQFLLRSDHSFLFSSSGIVLGDRMEGRPPLRGGIRSGSLGTFCAGGEMITRGARWLHKGVRYFRALGGRLVSRRCSLPAAGDEFQKLHFFGL